MTTTEKDLINTYTNKAKAMKATALRSLNASRRGEYSQYEVRQLGNGFIGGPINQTTKRFSSWKIVAQYSAGYYCDPRENF